MQLDLFLEVIALAPSTDLQATPWENLAEEERAVVVTTLARLMARAVTPKEGEDDE